MTERVEVGSDRLTDEQLVERILLIAWTALHTSRDRYLGQEAVPNGPPIKVPLYEARLRPDCTPHQVQVGEEMQQPTIGRDVLAPMNQAVTGECLLFTTTFNIESCAMDILGLGGKSPRALLSEQRVAVDSYMYRLCNLAFKCQDRGWLVLKVYRGDGLVPTKETAFDWSEDPPIACWAYTYQGLQAAREHAKLRGWEAAPNRGAGIPIAQMEIRA